MFRPLVKPSPLAWRQGILPNARRKGISALWVALISLLMVAIVGLAIDTGYLVWVAQQLQIGADASALSAAFDIRFGIPQARQAAVDLGLQNTAAGGPILIDLNDANDPAGDIVMGHFDRDTQIFDPLDLNVNAVKVVARRTDTSLGGAAPLLFGPIFGVDTANTERSAIAIQGGGTGGGLIALNPDVDCALIVGGSVNLIIDGGSIQVNSSDECAACFNGGILVDAESVDTVGGICQNGGGDLPAQHEGVPFQGDPLAFLEAPWPYVDMTNDLGTVSMTGGEILNISPGYYSGGISINNGFLTLEPGIYILDGAGFRVTGSPIVFADGVLLFITGTGQVEIAGSGEFFLSPLPFEPSTPAEDLIWDAWEALYLPPDPNALFTWADYRGIIIFQDRENTNSAKIIGTSLMDLVGSIYFPTAHIDLSGDSEKFGNQLIADTIKIGGNGELTINYEGLFAAPGGRVFLVQ